MDDVLECISGKGPGESHSWGRCAPMTLQVPGPSVIASTNRRGDDAPPEGRPKNSRHQTAGSMDDMKPETSSIDGEARATVMGAGSSGDDIKAHSITRKQSGTTSVCTSSVNKCKGKYRIMMKGPVCHGQACCGGI